MSDPPAPLRCPTCGAPIDVNRLRPGQTELSCAYCGTSVPVAATSRPFLIRITYDRAWIKSGWAGDPRVWGIFGLLVLGLVGFLAFGIISGAFGPR